MVAAGTPLQNLLTDPSLLRIRDSLVSDGLGNAHIESILHLEDLLTVHVRQVLQLLQVLR